MQIKNKCTGDSAQGRVGSYKLAINGLGLLVA
jgi:hypothetical protein